jgi:hypothetical protein
VSAFTQAQEQKQEQPAAGSTAPPAGKQPEAGTTAPPAAGEAQQQKIPELSHEEMEDELKRAQAEISGQKVPATGEFRPTKPLAADIAIALPSDF